MTSEGELQNHLPTLERTCEGETWIVTSYMVQSDSHRVNQWSRQIEVV